MPKLACQSSSQTLPVTGSPSQVSTLRPRVVARRWSSFVGNQMGLEDGCYDSHKRLRKESVTKQRGNQHGNRKPKTESNINNLFPPVADSAHECFAISTQHINSRDNHSPKRKHCRDLKDVKPFHLPTVLECSKEDHDFPGKISQTREA